MRHHAAAAVTGLRWQVFSEDAEVLIAQTFLRDSRFQMLKGANVLLMGSRHPPNKSYFLVRHTADCPDGTLCDYIVLRPQGYGFYHH